MGKVKNKAAWDKLKKLPIGTKVLVTAVMKDFGDRGSKRDGRKATHRWGTESHAGFEAWVTGASWRCDGEVTPPHGGQAFNGEDYDYEDGYLTVTKKTPVLLVREEMFGREMAVPIDGVGVASIPYDSKLGFCIQERAPLIKSYRLPANHPYREVMRKEMASAKRDEKGRWVKP